LRDVSEDKFLVMATAQGTIKKVSLKEFMRPRSTGIIAVELTEGDELIGVSITDGKHDLMLFTDVGKVIRFNEQDVRAMGRAARGVRGIRIQPNQKVIALLEINGNGAILTATERGFGKRTAVAEYPLKGRGGQGVISIQTTDRNGKVVSAIQVQDNDEVMLISDKGTLVRIRAADVSTVGRNTQGVTLINLAADESLVGVQRIDEITVPESSFRVINEDDLAPGDEFSLEETDGDEYSGESFLESENEQNDDINNDIES